MPNLTTSTIRPGLIVVLRTNITGNVTYIKSMIEAEYVTDDGKKRARWETERTIIDPAEHEEATKIRSKVRQTIAGICVQTAFGLLCPENKAPLLDTAIGEARTLAEEFNGRASTTRIATYVIAGKVAADDVEAVRAINSEVRDLMEVMEKGLASLDVKAVRDAADKARALGSMLSDDAASRVKEAIAVARKAATDIVKAAEVGGAELDLLAIQKITAARTSFLDISESVETATPEHDGRMLDLMPVAPATPEQAAPTIEIETNEPTPIAPAATEQKVPLFEM